ncbi:hypothetical protein [Zavarzinella formosa]|uniref:hypothetical protein n=1 Tax=Zavarzinella formosa TaxID=360055 RepID=UPI00030365A4|nr:hypothetical protein [Zavarzinella formosa]
MTTRLMRDLAWQAGLEAMDSMPQDRKEVGQRVMELVLCALELFDFRREEEKRKLNGPHGPQCDE